MKAFFNGAAVEARRDLVLELLPDEPLELRPASTITQAEGPADVAIEGATLRCAEPGRYRFVVDGAMDLHVCVFERAVLDHVAAHFRTVGHGDCLADGASAAKLRGVVRSLSNHAPFFTGKVDSLAGHSMAPFGC